MKIKISTFLNKHLLSKIGMTILPEKLILDVVKEAYEKEKLINQLKFKLTQYSSAWDNHDGGNA